MYSVYVYTCVYVYDLVKFDINDVTFLYSRPRRPLESSMMMLAEWQILMIVRWRILPNACLRVYSYRRKWLVQIIPQ